MANVVPEPSRWFDLDVHLGSLQLIENCVAATLNDVALDIIARALDAHVVRQGSQ